MAVILLVHLALVVWGGLGLLEFVVPEFAPVSLQNPAFPWGTQLLHWLAILSGGVLFVFGYFVRWRHTAFAMSVVYASMGTLCAVQTLDLLTSSGRYVSMLSEYVAYVSIAVFLHRSRTWRSHIDAHSGAARLRPSAPSGARTDVEHDFT